ncbi:MAG TPA: alpha/beta hydrolase [Solirubrobacteraceae bacterium]|nr:alpha/beta hydrolase [Solirubrobacteraceae bacterium]
MIHRAVEWWAGGSRLDGPGGHRVFVRTAGPPDGTWTTFLHGFPTSSLDWAGMFDRLRDERRLLALDFLGFGDSDKPKPHRYSLLEQADAVEAAWKHLGIERTALVAHDYGVSVAQELLARRDDRDLPVELTSVAFLNGGMIPSLHRPLAIQSLLAHPVAGPVLTRLTTERTFTGGLRRVIARPLADAELHEHWIAFTNRGGRDLAHPLLAYIAERRRYVARWEGAIARADVPLRFVWGPLDPVSGAHMLAELRLRRPDAAVADLAGVGHYPQLEEPDAVARELRELV